VALIALALALGAPAPAVAAPVEVTAMTRNLYLGADVGEALGLLPDLAAAAQVMWDQVAVTDFPRRAPLLAAEAAAARPDVIALQEATTWRCTAGVRSTVVFDFTRDFLAATEAAGVPYVVAEADGRRALNPGYSIGPIPRVTMVCDPSLFPSLFGTDRAACGFEIADALLVRADLADRVVRVGTSEFDDRYAVVPWLFEIDRGYAWADVEIDGATIRFAATHLESMWAAGAPVTGAAQARQLAAGLGSTELPLVVMGDFNADPRDPRPSGAANPGAQPDATTACAPQIGDPTAATAVADCNAYWTMVQAGYVDAGPDALDPANLTWGSSALLAGPDLARLGPSLDMGNAAGFTDRLDYILVRNGVDVEEARLLGATWPASEGLWSCDDPAQVANAEAAAAEITAVTGAPSALGADVCLPTDHAGLVVGLRVEPPTSEVTARAAATAPDANEPLVGRRTIALVVLSVGLVAVIAGLVLGTRAALRLLRRRRAAP